MHSTHNHIQIAHPTNIPHTYPYAHKDPSIPAHQPRARTHSIYKTAGRSMAPYIYTHTEAPTPTAQRSFILTGAADDLGDLGVLDSGIPAYIDR